MQLHIEKNVNDLNKKLANYITGYIQDVLKKQDRFTWALSGGNSPKKLYELLAQSPYREKIAWSKIHIFFGDERFVPFDDARNNGRMAYDALLRHVPIPYEQIHFMHTDVSPEDAAVAYEKLLHEYFSKSDQSFDLVLLGMGEDGHTLSLFPHSPLIHETQAWVRSVHVSDKELDRITLTPPVVNRAALIIFLVTGRNKASALRHVLEGPYMPDRFPAQLIRPQSSNLHWFIDEAAVDRGEY